jgi:hypothetical protein
MLPERAITPLLINFDAVLRHLWAGAVTSVKWDHEHYDAEALDALCKDNDPNRRGTIRRWLQAYRVFRVRGIATQKDKIADAVLTWADSRAHERNLDGPDALHAAYEELMTPVCDAYTHDSKNKRREFTSLTSKALWLCYPDKVPMFDSHAQRALLVLAKLESGIVAPPAGASDYHQFVFVWTQFYEKYRDAISNSDIHGYLYRVRVFDRVLWMIGKDQYTIPS